MRYTLAHTDLCLPLSRPRAQGSSPFSALLRVYGSLCGLFLELEAVKDGMKATVSLSPFFVCFSFVLLICFWQKITVSFQLFLKLSSL